MQARLRRASTAFVAVAATIGAAAITPSAGTAERPRQTDELRAQSRALAQRERGALLELYAFEAQLEQSRAELSAIRARSERLVRERVKLEGRLVIAKRTLTDSERMLSGRLLTLYQQDVSDPLAIVLGAESLDEAIARIDGLNALASQDARIAERTLDAKHSLTALVRSLARRTESLRLLERAAAAETRRLEREHGERVRYLDRLAAERRLNAARIGSLERGARDAQARSTRLYVPTSASAEGSGSPPAEDSGSGRSPTVGVGTLTVVATGYAISGLTATGIPTGPGVVAVDPAVIPLGTRLTIPGYGEGVAADIGGSVRGARIDLWFPTAAEALAWGQRTVTVSLH